MLFFSRRSSPAIHPTVLALAWLFLLFVAGVPGLAWAEVKNESEDVVYVKEELSEVVHTLKPGETFKDRQDGIAIPTIKLGVFFKTVDGVNAKVLKDGSVTTYGGSITAWLSQSVRGGLEGC